MCCEILFGLAPVRLAVFVKCKNSLEIVEKSDNVVYQKNVDSINVNMPSGTYGYLVLKSENNAYVIFIL